LRRWRCGPARRGTAWNEWRWLHSLAAAGVPAAEPIAYGEEVVAGWERRSAVVIAGVPGVSLERWCAARREPLSGSVRRALADLVAAFHALSVAHRDLYLSHIFGDGLESEAPALRLIDLQRVVDSRRRRRWIVKDLAALNYSTPAHAASPRARLRWLKRYLEQCEPEGREPGARFGRRDRILMRRIVGRSELMRRHDLKRRRRAPASLVEDGAFSDTWPWDRPTPARSDEVMCGRRHDVDEWK
jgi:hypothetical protein